jgi:hypothetical protein
MTKEERRGFCRSFLLEGTPAAFETEPMIYELMREWIARRLSVRAEVHIDPKEISLLGSARLGYSLSPYPKFGRPFGAASDLNFAAISRGLFDALCSDFSSWREHFEQKGVTPTTTREQKLWPQNIAVGNSKIYRDWEACVSQTCLNLNQAVPRNETLPAAFFRRGYWEWR